MSSYRTQPGSHDSGNCLTPRFGNQSPRTRAKPRCASGTRAPRLTTLRLFRFSVGIAAADADLRGFCRDADGLASRLGEPPGLPCGTYRGCWCGDA